VRLARRTNRATAEEGGARYELEYLTVIAQTPPAPASPSA